jgi:predicted GNAT family acetyltransferase
MKQPLEIRHNVERRRFETVVDGQLARADYRVDNGVLWLVHTEVPPPIGGRGIAAELVRAALAHAREAGLKVQPACSYVRRYIRQHPETHELLAAGARA